MQTFIMVAQLILALSILVVIHELGHFLAAKLFKIRVDKFYLFFDFLFPMPNVLKFSIFKIKKGGTEYGLGWFPMGGYVQIAGMVDENMNTEQLNQPAQDWEFRSKPAWQRMIVMLGGIIFNVILGVIIFAMISFTWGDKSTLNKSIKHGLHVSELAKELGFKEGDKLISVNGKQIVRFNDAITPNIILSDEVIYQVERENKTVEVKLPKDFLTKLTKDSRSGLFAPRSEVYVERIVENSNAKKAGLLAGDKIIAINDSGFKFFSEFKPIINSCAGSTAVLKVLRNGDTLVLNTKVEADGTIGFMAFDKSFEYETINYSFLESFPVGISKAVETIGTQIKGWGKIFGGDIPVSKAVQGPVGIAQFFGSEWIWQNFWMLTALISLGLAFANVLPIPALDGGHVVMLLIEMITRKPISIKIQERVQQAGMVILLSLMVLIFGNDIWQVLNR